MNNFKDRLIKAFPVFSQWLPKQKMFNQQLVAGAVAGDVAVSGIKKGDELISVVNLTAETDVTAEFSITDDGVINNVGGTTSDSQNLLVLYMQWQLR